jgi:hypothetical protein
MAVLFDWLRRKRAARARPSNAALLAERAFCDAYPSKRLITNLTTLLHDDGSSIVVQLCEHWGGIPPRRSWWLLHPDGACRELSREEANERRPVPPWR